MLKRIIKNNIKNIPGWRTDRKIVVIECDDWGGIRMPSRKVYDKLISNGFKLPGWFDRYDTMETYDDLVLLFEVLQSVKGNNGKPAVMTAFTNIANPDFHRIKSSGFSEYYYELFPETLKRYYPDYNVFQLWGEGITAGIFVPEYHGREHVAVQLWLKKLREGDNNLLFLFDQESLSLQISGISKHKEGLRAEFFFTSEDEKPFLINSLKEGLSLFKKIFGYSPKVFVPGNGILHPDFNHLVAACGIRFLNVNRSTPYPRGVNRIKYSHFITGQKGPGGLVYYRRNCSFEPSSYNYMGIGHTVEQISSAFRWGKPAIISTHRVNFAGGLVPANREKGLIEMKQLLKDIVKRWPDIEFMSSVDALEYMKSTN